MARQMLGPILRQALGHYLEVDEHELDISGQLSLTAVKLRKQRAGPASVSGHVGSISARWSWSELLRQPVVVNLTDVNIQICLTESEESEKSSQAMLAEPGFFGRLKRRLVDQLDLTIANCQVSFTGLEAVAGASFKKLSVAAVEAGEQAVQLQELELYLGPADTPHSIDAVDSTHGTYLPPPAPVFLRASPSGRALRFAGQRFVDLRGLDLQIDFQAVHVHWTHTQLAGLSTLLRNFRDLRDFKDCDSDEFVDIVDSGETRQPRQSWSAWLRSWGQEGLEECKQSNQTEAETWELPMNLRKSMEESPVGKEDFSFSLTIPSVVIAFDDSLEVDLSGHMAFHLHEHDFWSIDMHLTRFDLLECLGAEGKVRIGGMAGASNFAIKADSFQKMLSVQSPELDLRVTPSLLRFGLWAQAGAQALSSETYEASTSDMLDWRVSLHMPLSIEIGKPWHSRMLLLEAVLVYHEGGDCSMRSKLLLDGEDVIEEFDLRLRSSDKLLATTELICGHCDIRDFVSITRLFKTICNFTGAPHLQTGPPTDIEIELQVPTIKLNLSDEDIDLDCEFLCHGVAIGFMQQSAVGIRADDVGITVAAAGKERGSLTVVKPVVSASFLEGFEAQIDCELYCRDPESEERAVCCPSLKCIFLERMQREQRAVTLECYLQLISLNTTEAFLQSCRVAMEYAYDHAQAAFFIEPVFLEERPFGLSVEATETVATANGPVRWLAGSAVRGMEPPVTALLQDLQNRPLPVVVLFERPSQIRCFTVHVHPFVLNAADFSVQRGVRARLEKTDIHFKDFQQSMEASWTGLMQKLAKHYLAQAAASLPKLFCNASIAGLSLFDGTISSAGTSLAFLRFGGAAVPQGALAGTLAKAVASATSSSLEKGRKLRGSDSYQFGDLTRGLVSLSWERGVGGSVSTAAEHAYETRAVSSTVGASVGGVLLAPLGPAGVTAGMMGGAAAGRRTSESAGRRASALQQSICQTLAEGREVRESASAEHEESRSSGGGYRFGDFTRGLVRAGREARGGESYKLGDLTRGAWSKMKR
ncbi:unnamed protein product [Symbiodinium sp. CCMP2592]|nr:unnamed protein product [Symbiodinium sp. CCMP2592]